MRKAREISFCEPSASKVHGTGTINAHGERAARTAAGSILMNLEAAAVGTS
jgi:hypothetical protein